MVDALDLIGEYVRPELSSFLRLASMPVPKGANQVLVRWFLGWFL